MSGVTISERCSCGAQFTITSSIFPNETIQKWRDNHRHDFPPKEEGNGIPTGDGSRRAVPAATAAPFAR